MRVLIGCEESGVGRREFRARGHDAYSNDLIPARDSSPYHLQMCVTEAIKKHGPWDIIILHYECTEMAVCANRWYAEGKPGWPKRQAALNWSEDLWERVWRMAKSATRKRDRSESYPGIMAAMAEQWGGL